MWIAINVIQINASVHLISSIKIKVALYLSNGLSNLFLFYLFYGRHIVNRF